MKPADLVTMGLPNKTHLERMFMTLNGGGGGEVYYDTFYDSIMTLKGGGPGG